MGTSYTILEKGKLRIELDEMSNAFSLTLEGKVVVQDAKDREEPNYAATSTHLTPEDLIGMALEMLKVATYFEPNGLHELIDKYVDASPDRHYLRSDVLAQVAMAVRT